jgi:hypothetical protein
MAMSAATAVSTLTMLSSASENRATLPVMRKAMYLMPITASAIAMLAAATYWCRLWLGCTGVFMRRH